MWSGELNIDKHLSNITSALRELVSYLGYFFQKISHGSFARAIKYEVVSKSFRTGRLERELQMVQLSATRCSCIAIL
jgi:hypothetical protein